MMTISTNNNNSSSSSRRQKRIIFNNNYYCTTTTVVVVVVVVVLLCFTPAIVLSKRWQPSSSSSSYAAIIGSNNRHLLLSSPFYVHARIDPVTNHNTIISATTSISAGGGSSSSSSPSRGGSVRPAIIQQEQNNDNEQQQQQQQNEEKKITTDTTTTNTNTDTDTTLDTTIFNSNDKTPMIDSHHPIIHHHNSKKERKKEIKNYKKYAKKLKNRNARNLQRKVMHCSFGLFFTTLNHFIPKKIFVTGMVILSSGTLLMELLRYKKGFHWMNDALHFVLGNSLRKHEMEGKFTGSFYFFTGVTCTAALFDRNAATLGIAQLALADPSASYFGRATRHIYWSRIENGLGGFGRNKGILGFLGGALFCFPFNYRVLSIAKYGITESTSSLPGGKSAIVIASLALGIAGAFADLAVPTPAITLPKKLLGINNLPPLHIDDNMVVPIFSAYAAEQIFKYMEWKFNYIHLAKFLLLSGLPFNNKSTKNIIPTTIEAVTTATSTDPASV